MRKIIHCDFDCFYAAIEIRDKPKLKNLPIAIGGRSNKRGVIATCNYEARAYGVHSAMASSQAIKLCPDIILIRPNMSKYKEASQQAHRIFQHYSTKIEPLSLDEAFLDVSNSEHHQGSATRIAAAIRKNIEEEIGVTASAGIAPNKFLAKIASDWNKPNGQFTIHPNDVDAFVKQLPVENIFGVGKVTKRKLKKHGIVLCDDLRRYSKLALITQFGSFGDRLYELCRGIDERPVKSHRIRKSISVENTYSKDINDIDEALKALAPLEKKLMQRYSAIQHEYHCFSLIVKVKFSDFTQTTIERSIESSNERYIEKNSEAYQTLMAPSLLKEAFGRKDLGMRLLGLGFKLKPARQKNIDQFTLDI